MAKAAARMRACGVAQLLVIAASWLGSSFVLPVSKMFSGPETTCRLGAV